MSADRSEVERGARPVVDRPHGPQHLVHHHGRRPPDLHSIVAGEDGPHLRQHVRPKAPEVLEDRGRRHVIRMRRSRMRNQRADTAIGVPQDYTVREVE